MKKTATLALAASMLAALPAVAQTGDSVNDFPTIARADYVYGCIKVNGETRTALERCSCSIDVIATIIPYQRYEEASTFLSIGQVTGEKGVVYRTSEESKAAIGDLRRAQAEAEVRCF